MDCDDVFKLDVSLEKFSAIALAIGLWEHPDVKKKINDDFYLGRFTESNLDKVNCADVHEDNELPGKNVIYFIFQKLDVMKIPDKLVQLIKTLVVKIGQKISYWRQYVSDVLKLSSKYAGKIYWTSFGQIDELKIMQEFWLKDSEFSCEKCKCFLRSYSYHCLTAMYAEETLAEEHLKNMKYKINLYLPKQYKEQVKTSYGVIATWTVLCTSQKRTPALERFKIFGKAPDSLPAKELLYICIENENNFGAKYFWSKLDLLERQRLVTEAATKCLKLKSPLGYNLRRQSRTTYKTAFTKEKSTNMLLFLINEMTETDRIKFLSSNFINIFVLLLQIWPYQELCQKLVEQFWNYIPERHVEVLQLVFNYIIPDIVSKPEYPEYFTDKNFYKKLFGFLMERLERNIKIQFFTWNDYNSLRKVYERFDNDLLHIILNDKDLKNDYREGMLSIGDKYIQEILLNGNNETVSRFIENMNFSAVEIKLFKEKFNSLNIFLANGELTLAEKHLDWLVDSDAEKNEMKNKVDALEICFVLIQNNKFEAANEFLLWRFHEEEKRASLKKALKSDDFIKNKIFQIWGSCDLISTEEVCLKCSKLLSFFFGSEENSVESIDFRKAIIQDKFLIEKYWNAQFKTETLKYFNNFLNFCSMTTEEIDVLKIDTANNITWWIETYMLEKSQFDLLRAVFDWVYENNEEEKKKVIEKYMSTPRGSLLCINMFKKCWKTSPSDILDIVNFFNSWVTPALNIQGLIMLVDKCDETIVGPRVISYIKDLLNIRERDVLVRVEDLEDHMRFNVCWKLHDGDDHDSGRAVRRLGNYSGENCGRENFVNEVEEDVIVDDEDEDDDDDDDDGYTDSRISNMYNEADEDSDDDDDWET